VWLYRGDLERIPSARVRRGDEQWFGIVRSRFAISSGELGVTQANLDEMIKIERPRSCAGF
jgi:hypothetical protein